MNPKVDQGTKARKGGPARTGSLDWARRHGRVRLADGSREGIAIPDEITTEKRARECVAAIQEQENAHCGLLAKRLRERAKRPGGVRAALAPGETCDAWYERFAAYRRAEVGSVDDDRCGWTKWISPHLGPKSIRDVTPDDIEDVRDALNAAVLAYEAAGAVKGEGQLAPKTAHHIWSSLTTAMKYASTRKGPRELRVREDKGNPCLGIPPPRDGASKSRCVARASLRSRRRARYSEADGRAHAQRRPESDLRA